MPNKDTYTDEQVLELLKGTIGTRYTENLLDDIEDLTGRPVRPILPDLPVTRDHRRQRLNLIIDDCNVITSMRFG